MMGVATIAGFGGIGMLVGVLVWMALLALLIWGIASLLPVQRGG